MKFVKIAVAILIVLAIALLINQCGKKTTYTAVSVDCGTESLAEVVSNSEARTRINVVGTCEENEAVVVSENDIIIDGKGTAVIDGQNQGRPVITVDGAKNVIINGLTVTNGRHGILAINGATVVLNDISAVNNTGIGIALVKKGGRIPETPDTTPPINKQSAISDSVDLCINDCKSTEKPKGFDFKSIVFNTNLINPAYANDQPHCTVTNEIISDESYDGDFLYLGDTQVFCGTINANDNASHGVFVDENSTLYVYAMVNMLENAGIGYQQYFGLSVFDSDVHIRSNSTVVARGHSLHGIQIQDGARLMIYGPETGIESTLNTGAGLYVGEDDAEVECTGSGIVWTLTGNGSSLQPGDAGSRISGCTIN